MSYLENHIKGTIVADNIQIGRGVVVGSGTVIEAENVVLGDGAFVGNDVVIKTKDFFIGDYSRIQAGTVGYGSKQLGIGRNCWIGGRCDLDSQGGLFIDDNVGIGSMSQIWTHIRHGDVVEGCRFNSTAEVHIGKDAWFVGSCLVSPVVVGERSMAMLGSVITRDMLPNRTYGGCPATDITDRVGPQFHNVSMWEKLERLKKLISDFENQYPEFVGKLVAVSDGNEIGVDDDRTYFDLGTRTYTKRFTEPEVLFLKTNGVAKFVPR
ncbi:MAG: hypothetical protein RIR69_1591 [Actinomycetota bacterium]|jgi:acetyltransferase-like isoleucine patch superfamily enzyme